MKNIFSEILSRICKTFGHRWRYKDYSNHMKTNGDKYDFSASRQCLRCGQNAYFYAEWQNETKSVHDYESAYHSLNKLLINKVVYN